MGRPVVPPSTQGLVREDGARREDRAAERRESLVRARDKKVWRMFELLSGVVTVDGRNPAPLGNHGKPSLVHIYRGIIAPGCLRWCRVSSSHSIIFGSCLIMQPEMVVFGIKQQTKIVLVWLNQGSEEMVFVPLFRDARFGWF